MYTHTSTPIYTHTQTTELQIKFIHTHNETRSFLREPPPACPPPPLSLAPKMQKDNKRHAEIRTTIFRNKQTNVTGTIQGPEGL